MKEGDYMATSGTSGSYSNISRMTGLSGFDVDSTVAKLMKVETAKLDKVKKEKQTLQWKQELYRSVTTLLQGFSSNYLSSMNSSSNILSSGAFSAFGAKYNNLDSSSYFSVTTGSATKAGNYTISNIVTALSAQKTGSDLSAAVEGSSLSSIGINAANDNNQVNVTFNGTTKLITLADATDINSLKTDLQNKLNSAFGSGKITVGIDGTSGNQLTFNTDYTNSVSFGYAYNEGYNKIFGSSVSSGLTTTAQNNKFTVTLGTETKTFALPAGTTYADADAVASAVQNLIDDGTNGFGAGQIRVLNQNGTLALKAIGSDSVSTAGSSSIISSTITDGFVVDSSNQTLSIAVGTGDAKTITLDAKTYTKKSDLLNAIQAKLNTAFGNNKVMVSLDSSNKLRFESVSSNTAPTAGKVENGGLSAIGLNVNTSNKISADAKLYDIKDSFNTKLTVAGAADDIKFTINNKEFKFSSKSTSLNDIIRAVNADTDANVNMSYDSLNNKVTLKTKDTGVAVTLNASDTSGGVLTALGVTASGLTGRDASMTYNDGVNGDQVITRSSNTFAVNGISFTLKQDTTTSTALSINSDPSKAVEMIKGFVDNYNKVLDKINTLMYEQHDRNYTPLTDSQKEAMKDTEITNWETKAKTGLLGNDPTLESMAYKMRNTILDTKSDGGLSLAAIGISSTYYTDKGKLSIDETKLKKALTEKPDEVINLFTKTSTISYTEAANDSDKATQRYSESGLANRLNDIIQDAVRTTPNTKGMKGTIAEKAGILGTSTSYNNILSLQIEDQDDKITSLTDYLTTKENEYYTKFSKMESLISQMSAQSSMFGS